MALIGSTYLRKENAVRPPWVNIQASTDCFYVNIRCQISYGVNKRKAMTASWNKPHLWTQQAWTELNSAHEDVSRSGVCLCCVGLYFGVAMCVYFLYLAMFLSCSLTLCSRLSYYCLPCLVPCPSVSCYLVKSCAFNNLGFVLFLVCQCLWFHAVTLVPTKEWRVVMLIQLP